MVNSWKLDFICGKREQSLLTLIYFLCKFASAYSSWKQVQGPITIELPLCIKYATCDYHSLYIKSWEVHFPVMKWKNHKNCCISLSFTLTMAFILRYIAPHCQDKQKMLPTTTERLIQKYYSGKMGSKAK